MNQLSYNGVVLDTLGEIQVLGQSTARLPAEAPQYERVTVKVKLDFFETSYAENRALVELVRAALRTQQATMVWSDSTGGTMVSRTVTAGDDEQPEADNAQGTYRQSLVFSFTYEDYNVVSNVAGATVQKSGGALLSLGNVMHWREGFSSALWSETSKAVRRTGGTLSASGFLPGNTATALATRRATLLAAKDALMAAMQQGDDVTLTRGDWTQVVRVTEFTAEVDAATEKIGWSLTGTWTRWPNEADFAASEWHLAPKANQIEGTVSLSFTGRIAAPTVAAAQAKLAKLRTQVIPAGYTMTESDSDEHQAETEGRDEGMATATTAAFMELTWSETWAKYDGDVVKWTLRVATTEEEGVGYATTSYGGSVTAKGATDAAAYQTALAKATALGAGKLPFLMRNETTRVGGATMTGAPFFVSVDFNYAYRSQGARVWMELQASVSRETFGEDTERVSGRIKAASLAAAETIYTTVVLPLYAARLVLQEQRPTRNWTRQDAGESGGGGTAQDGDYAFSLSVALPKAAADTAMVYSVEVLSDFLKLEKLSTVQGSVSAADEQTAIDFLEGYLATMGLGTEVSRRRRSDWKVGRKAVGEAKATQFGRLDFSAVFVGTLTGAAGILECEVDEEVTYSGARLVERPLPDGPSIIQTCGTTCGTRMVSGSVTAATEAAALAWAASCRTLMIGLTAGSYEMPAYRKTGFRFAPRTSGVAKGTGANVRVYQVQFRYGEMNPTLV